LRAVEASDADVVAFYPYLYYPTVRGLPLVRDRAILHPAAHEEPALHLGVFDALFSECRGFAFHTRSERRLVVERFGVATTPQVVVGLGVEESEGSAEVARAAFDLGDAPYLLCIGRVDDKKGTGILWRYFRSYKERHPGPLRLVLVGQIVDPPDPGRDIVVTGMIDDASKWGLLRGAHAVVAPSPFESFSLTVVEGMTAGAPAIVNAVCGATREHCEQSGAGMWFEGYAEFEAVLDRLLADSVLHETMRQNGFRYVESTYRWPVVMARYGAFLEAFVERRPMSLP
jgi:glycosyltransferase involved in cell wall biosynthesis